MSCFVKSFWLFEGVEGLKGFFRFIFTLGAINKIKHQRATPPLTFNFTLSLVSF
jgi:hypothetical protein